MDKPRGYLSRIKHRAILSAAVTAVAAGCAGERRVTGFVNEEYYYPRSSASHMAEDACRRTLLQAKEDVTTSDIKSCMEAKGWTYIDRTERRMWFGFGNLF